MEKYNIPQPMKLMVINYTERNCELHFFSHVQL